MFMSQLFDVNLLHSSTSMSHYRNSVPLDIYGETCTSSRKGVLILFQYASQCWMQSLERWTWQLFLKLRTKYLM